MKQKRGIYILITMIFLLLIMGCNCKTSKNETSRRQIEKRAQNLLEQMTLSEKIDLLTGSGMATKPNVRLGIPELKMTDGPLGPNGKGQATNYSACIAMAATWDEPLIERVGQAIGEETRGLGFNMLLGPCINIGRVPHGGRTFESFGEDPYLTSRMAVAYIKGIQREGIVACAKHFACNNQEWNRFDVDVLVDERTLREIYLPAFKAAAQEAGTLAIMAAYNRINGVYACENRYLLTDILRCEWEFPGIVISDWGAIKSTVATANAGLDLEMPEATYMGEKLLQAINSGQVAESLIDDKVRRLLRVMLTAGLFDKSMAIDSSAVNTKEHRALALEVARKAIVLLKNDQHILPLNREGISSIAVFGPNANEAQLYGGGSGSLESFYKISLLQGLKNKADNKISIQFTRGLATRRTELPVVDSLLLIPSQAKPGEHGLCGEYFNNRDVQGRPVLVRIDKQIDFNWKRESPVPGIVNPDKFSVRWTGTLIAPGTGSYEIGVNADNGVRLYLNNHLVVDFWTDAAPDQLKSASVDLVSGHHYDLRIEFYENIGDAMAKLGLAPVITSKVEIAKAVTMARDADIAIVCAGLDKNLEGEAHDREELELPDEQIALIRASASVNKKTIVVLNNATPILMNDWIDQVPVIIEAWYTGQECGNALADILFGEINPSGKLPLTFPNSWEDSPVYHTYPGSKEVANYSEGIFVGYRHFDKHHLEPRFPFGYGISYTQFDYHNLTINPQTITRDDIAKIKVTITNSGTMAGDEIVQLYVRDVEASVERPIKELKGFKRVTLKPAGQRTVTFFLDRDALAFYDVNSKQWIAESGEFEVMVGSSSCDIRLTGFFELREE
jgi:beta-glucosidase